MFFSTTSIFPDVEHFMISHSFPCLNFIASCFFAPSRLPRRVPEIFTPTVFSYTNKIKTFPQNLALIHLTATARTNAFYRWMTMDGRRSPRRHHVVTLVFKFLLPRGPVRAKKKKREKLVVEKAFYACTVLPKDNNN